jgi:hypothetical protein
MYEIKDGYNGKQHGETKAKNPPVNANNIVTFSKKYHLLRNSIRYSYIINSGYNVKIIHICKKRGFIYEER